MRCTQLAATSSSLGLRENMTSSINQKYIRITTPPEEDRIAATGNTHKNLVRLDGCVVHSSRDILVDRPTVTDRQTDTVITLLRSPKGVKYTYTVSQKSEPPKHFILQQPPQTCTDLNEILHTQDIYFCHRRQIS